MTVTQCSVEDCGADVDRKGYCQRHYVRQWRHGTTALAGPKPKPCKKCGETFQPVNNRAAYCSDTCRQGQATCLECGTTFQVTKGTTGKYCSTDCWYTSDRGSEKTCPVCSATFKGMTKTCSKDCGYALRRKNHPARQMSCENCGGSIDAKKKPGTRFCSRSCNMQTREQQRWAHLPIGSTRPYNGYTQIKTENGWEFQHRLVLGEKIGRPLKPWPQENVHHRDGVRTNNDPANLELRIGASHGPGASQHCPTCTCETT